MKTKKRLIPKIPYRYRNIVASFTKSDGNVFADLLLENADEMLAKARQLNELATTYTEFIQDPVQKALLAEEYLRSACDEWVAFCQTLKQRNGQTIEVVGAGLEPATGGL